jgi:hypothetical protein
MAEPENQTLRLLRELWDQNKSLQSEMLDQSNSLRSEMREGFDNISDRLKNLQQAMIHSRPIHGCGSRRTPQ